MATNTITLATENIKKLFQEHIRGKGDAFMRYSQAAMDRFLNQGLPGKKTEDYKYFPVFRNYPEKFELKHDQPEIDPVLFESIKLQDSNAIHLFFINGILNGEYSNPDHASGSITIKPLSDLKKEEFDKYFIDSYKRFNINNDPFIDLNNAFVGMGVFIKVNKRTESIPVYCYHISKDQKNTELINSQSVIILEKDSKLELTEFYISESGKGGFENHLTEVFADNGVKFNYYKVQQKSAEETHINHTNIYQRSNSNVNTFTFSLKGKLLRNNLNFILDEENCESHLYGLYYLRNNDLIDNHTTVDHRKANCFSNENYKGVIDDHAKGIFNGKIYVRPNAQKTNAFQSNKNIVLTDTATINTKPQLEIWADDVKCSHGATTGQIDDEQLFYLRSRGLDLKTAKALLLHAYAFEIVDKVDQAPLKKFLAQKLNDQLGYQIKD